MQDVDELWSVDLGTVPYREGWDLQERVRAARQDDAIPDTVLWLEHPPVYTRGRRTDAAELPLGDAWYAEQGIEIVDVPRGGRVTYHGPGQLVGYPIVRVDGAFEHVQRLERAIVAALGDLGVAARGRSDEDLSLTGVWVAERKIASLGVHVRRHVSTHGLAVNVVNDLAPFGWIVPCGLPEATMTSVAAEQGPGCAIDVACVRQRLGVRLAEQLGRRQRLVSAARLREALAPVTAHS